MLSASIIYKYIYIQYKMDYDIIKTTIQSHLMHESIQDALKET